MKYSGQTIKQLLGAAAWNELQRRALRAGISNAELIARAVQQWLGRQKPLVDEPTKDKAALQKLAAVNKLQQMRIFADRRREPLNVARLLRLLRFEGIKASRASLFNWDRAYRRGGVAALADRRTIESKGRSKGHRR